MSKAIPKTHLLFSIYETYSSAIKRATHGRLTGMSLSELKLIQAAFRGEVIPRVLYDITSSYFERAYAESELALFGYNRDGKRWHVTVPESDQQPQ